MGRESKERDFLPSPEHLLLGEEFERICQDNGLDKEGIKIVDQIYLEWQNLFGQTEEKISVVEQYSRGYQNIGGVAKSLVEISIKYLEKKQTGRKLN